MELSLIFSLQLQTANNLRGPFISSSNHLQEHTRTHRHQPPFNFRISKLTTDVRNPSMTEYRKEIWQLCQNFSFSLRHCSSIYDFYV